MPVKKIKSKTKKIANKKGEVLVTSKKKKVEKKYTLSDYKKFVEQKLLHLTPYLQRVAMGDFSRIIKLPEKEDEFTELVVSINLMIEDLKELKDENDKIKKDLEKKINNSSNKLSESEQRFRESFQNSSAGMALVSPEGKWLQVNPALLHILGYSEKQLLAKTFQDITHPDDLERDLEYIKQMLNGEITTYQMEKRYFHKNGKIIWVLLNVSIVRDDNKKPLYFVSQIQDITVRKKAQSELENKLEELEQMNKLMVGRELKMVELKDKISKLEGILN